MRLSIFFRLFFFSMIILVVDYQVVAQTPESMNYQAVIRNGSGDIVASQSVGIRIKILQGSTSGSSVYEETFTPSTNAYGSIAIQIGNGTVVSGTFNAIDWGGNSYFVETAVDISGGTNYTVISTTQFVSVPYALYAKNARLDSAAVQGMIDASGSSGSLHGSFSASADTSWVIPAGIGMIEIEISGADGSSGSSVMCPYYSSSTPLPGCTGGKGGSALLLLNTNIGDTIGFVIGQINTNSGANGGDSMIYINGNLAFVAGGGEGGDDACCQLGSGYSQCNQANGSCYPYPTSGSSGSSGSPSVNSGLILLSTGSVGGGLLNIRFWIINNKYHFYYFQFAFC